MKKITFLLILLFGAFSTSFGQLTEDFEGSITIPAGWAVFDNGIGTTESWQISDGATNNVAYVNWEAVTGTAEDWLVSPQFTVSATNYILSFDQTDSFATDYGSVYTVRVSTGTSQTTPGDFTIVDTQTEVDVWAGGPLAQHTVDLTAYIGLPIYVAFVMENNDGDRWILDNIDMIANATAPDPVTTPTPTDMSVDVVIDTANSNAVAFSWTPATTGDPATAYDVYLGDSPTTLSLLGTLGATSVNITGMTYSTLYYWQIVAKNVGGTATGSSIWSFTTEADPSLSVDDFNVNNNFSIYPNPTSDVVNIKTDLIINSVEIFNQLGQRVKQINTTNLNNNSIDVKDLNTGIYLMTITSKNKKQTFKFIKE